MSVMLNEFLGKVGKLKLQNVRQMPICFLRNEVVSYHNVK